ncbi:MAG: malonate transporter [Candidatus Azotimanducaceae bacterium]|jgi:malonate transporter
MLTGYLVGYFKVLPNSGSTILSQFVYIVALPALAFIKLSQVPVNVFFNWPFLAVLGGGMLITFCFSLVIAYFFFPTHLTGRALHALSAMYSSTGYIGLPIIFLVFGDSAFVPGIIGAVITGAVFMPLAIILIEADKSADSDKVAACLKAMLKSIFKNPVLIATTAGLIISSQPIELAEPVVTFFELLAGAYIPCALFAAGLFISGCSVKGETTEIAWLVFVKLLIHPLITWWLAYEVFDLEGTLPAIAVLQAALPCGVPVFVLAQHYKTFVVRASGVIVISTLLSLISLSALLIFLDI